MTMHFITTIYHAQYLYVMDSHVRSANNPEHLYANWSNHIKSLCVIFSSTLTHVHPANPCTPYLMHGRLDVDGVNHCISWHQHTHVCLKVECWLCKWVDGNYPHNAVANVEQPLTPLSCKLKSFQANHTILQGWMTSYLCIKLYINIWKDSSTMRSDQHLTRISVIN